MDEGDYVRDILRGQTPTVTFDTAVGGSSTAPYQEPTAKATTTTKATTTAKTGTTAKSPPKATVKTTKSKNKIDDLTSKRIPAVPTQTKAPPTRVASEATTKSSARNCFCTNAS